MRRVLCAIALAIPVVGFTQVPADSVSVRAKRRHDRAIVVDSHDHTIRSGTKLIPHDAHS
jgi:hypothetical protein